MRKTIPSAGHISVALRKESVDRNFLGGRNRKLILMSLSARRAWIEICGGAFARRSALSSLSARRAWIEIKTSQYSMYLLLSLSARRAWIEMLICAFWTALSRSLSARRAWIEIQNARPDIRQHESLSARRAWIEIGNSCTQAVPLKVALRKESVDRNCFLWC